jgi:hypothetical protein
MDSIEKVACKNSCCVWICCRGNVFNELLHDKKIADTNRVMGGFHETKSSDWHICLDIHIKFHNHWFSPSEVNGRRIQRQHDDSINLLKSKLTLSP